MECMVYSVVVPSDPMNCDDQIYSDIQTDIIDPKPFHRIIPTVIILIAVVLQSIKSVLLRTESSIK